MGRKVHPDTGLDEVPSLPEREFYLVSESEGFAIGVQNPLHLMLRWKLFQIAYFKAKSKQLSYVIFSLPRSTLVFITQHCLEVEPEMTYDEAMKLVVYFDDHKILALQQMAFQYLDQNPMAVHQAVTMWRLSLKEKNFRAKHYAANRVRELQDISDDNGASIEEAVGQMLPAMDAEDLLDFISGMRSSSPQPVRE
ncbi:hypothetical protein CJU90_5239 [Yarrowia sp. C11]|nr:hypothetical protein CJU90_5239 [Yarrowia sp. C11]KAG5365036.1 hypothetical protein CKK34_3867 [Yarrowia sp. E02]